MSINELDDMPTPEEQAAVSGVDTKLKEADIKDTAVDGDIVKSPNVGLKPEAEEVTVITDVNKKTEETSPMSPVVTQLPKANVEVKLIEDDVVKTVRLKEVEDMIATKNMINMTDANIVQEAYPSLFFIIPQKTFTTTPSKVNLAKLRSVLKTAVAVECDNIATKVTEFNKNYLPSTDEAIDAIEKECWAFEREVDGTYEAFLALFDLVVAKGRICFIKHANTEEDTIVPVRDQTLTSIQSCYTYGDPEVSKDNKQVYASVCASEIKDMLESVNKLTYPLFMKLQELAGDTKIGTMYQDIAPEEPPTLGSIAQCFFPKTIVDAFTKFIHSRVEILRRNKEAIKTTEQALKDSVIEHAEDHVKMLKSTVEEVEMLTQVLACYKVIYKGLLTIFRVSCPDYKEG